MRLLILGGAGMLGHKLYQTFQPRYETWVTFRGSARDYAHLGLFDPARSIDGVDGFNFDSLTGALARARPDVVVNCIGIIKQLPTATDPITSLTINALLPHRLAALCRAAGARLFHISTDCVFSGRKGGYTEADVSDAEDLYGRTKFLGEVSGPGSLTLRTSIIGRELRTTSGLVEWFLSQRGQHVRGYTRAIYTGFTTLELARVIAQLIEAWPSLTGLYQVSSEPISKYDLLCQLAEAWRLPIEIEPDAAVAIDRSLDSTRFRQATGYTPPPWPDMLRELAGDPTPYTDWRRTHAAG
jgi:dTDP-4-dehydrorhamnose reductase